MMDERQLNYHLLPYEALAWVEQILLKYIHVLNVGFT